MPGKQRKERAHFGDLAVVVFIFLRASRPTKKRQEQAFFWEKSVGETHDECSQISRR